MKHALIIEQQMAIGRFMKERLLPLGFRSFELVSTEEEAVASAERRRPDLIVIGCNVAAGSGIEAARRICAKRDVPVLLVARAGAPRPGGLPADARLEGPFPPEGLEQRVAATATGQGGRRDRRAARTAGASLRIRFPLH